MVQVIVADVPEMPDDVTALIAGMVTRVENVKLAEAPVPAESVEITAKLYEVAGVSPVRVTVCEMTRLELSVESEP